ncbi:MAG TPA: class I SAM-dependent methyltransferase [Candidatus Binatia bacterium]
MRRSVAIKIFTSEGLCLAVVLAVAVQALALGAAWAQEAAQPRFDEEIAKQQKIFNSRGADVPAGYITGRTLLSYLQMLPGFCGSLGALDSSDRWLDIGAGAGQAILDYYSTEADSMAKMCTGSRGKVRAVAMSIEDRRTDKWHRRAASLGDDRIRYLAGKRLRQYSPEELGKFQIITDVFGGFSYTDDLSGFVERTLRLLEVGGVFYTLMQSVHLERGEDMPNTSYLTELVDTSGRDDKVCAWLKRTVCVEVTCESKNNWRAPTELIAVKKICGEVSVPRMKLLKYEAGDPPGRRFVMEP